MSSSSSSESSIWYHICKEQETNEISVLLYISDILNFEEYDFVKSWLDEKYHNGIFKGGEGVEGKEVPRKQIWFQQNGHYFCKTWKSRIQRWKSETYDDRLQMIQQWIEDKIKKLDMQRLIQNDKHSLIDLDININSCLVNLYRNGQDSISPHRDSVESFGTYPTIIGLSIGETRIMRIQRVLYNPENLKSCKFDHESSRKGLMMDIPLEDNSIFIMMGSSQKYYTHEIVKDDTITKPRYSMTFRKYIG